MTSNEIIGECVESVYSGDCIIDAPSPRSTMESVEECRGYCKENICGNYGKSWTCPPFIDPPQACIDKLDSFTSAIIVPKTFEVDYTDKDAVEKCTDIMQKIARDIAHALIDKGIDAFPLADGACKYCGKCTCVDGEPCRDPYNKVGSVSAFGILIKDYMESVGLELAPLGNSLTLYSYVLY